MAINAGWKNVYWLRGGFPEWKQAGLPVESKQEHVFAKKPGLPGFLHAAENLFRLRRWEPIVPCCLAERL